MTSRPDRTRIVVFVAAWGAAATVLTALMRLPLGVSEFGIAPLTYLRSWALLLAVLAIPELTARLGRDWAVRVLAGAGALVALGLWIGAVGPWLGVLVDVVVWPLAGLALWQVWRDRAGEFWVAAGLGGVAALGQMLIVLTGGIGTPALFEFALAGLAHKDSLYHAALAQSLAADGVVSTALDGRVPLKYHAMSHWVIAGFAGWTGTQMLHAYALALSCILVPGLIARLLDVAQLLGGARRGGLAPLAAMVGLVGWVQVLAATGGGSFWVSESYALSLWLLLSSIPLMAIWLRAGDIRLRVLAVGLMAALVWITALTKISTGAVLAVGVAAAIALAGPIWAWALGAVAGVGPFLAVYLQGWGTRGDTGGASIIGPFAYWADYPQHAIVHAIFAGVVIRLIWRHRPADLADQRVALALGAMALAALAGASLLDLPAGAEFYFINPGLWAGLCLIPMLSVAPRWVARKAPARQVVWVAALFVLAVAVDFDNRWKGLGRFADTLTRVEAIATPGDAPLADRVLTGSPAGEVFAAVRAANADGIYVAPDAATFWALSPECWPASLILPATTGVPMLLGRPVEGPDCAVSPHYGMALYPPAQSASRVLTDAVLAELAATRQMSRVAVLRGSGPVEICDCTDSAPRP